MKTAETKTSSSAQSKQGGKPFFGKDGDSFFEKPVQAKLSVGKTNDRYEKEADSMADKVVQRLATGSIKNEEEQKVQAKPENLSQTITPLVQQKCKHCEEEEKEEVQRKPIFESEAEAPVQKKCDNGPVPSIQPKCKHCEEEEKHHEKEEQEDGGAIQRVSCRECEEGNKVLMKPMPGIQRAEEDQTPKNDGSRTSILAAAKGELGKVHARTNDGTGRRVGADRLNEYFKIAAPDVWDESIITTAGVEMPSWCGIFSVWAHKKAGKNLGNWQMGKGVSAFGTLTNTTSPQPGDIGYIHKQNQHHAIVKEIQGDKVITIDGNSGMTSEVKENTKPRSAYTLFMTAFGAGGGSGDVQKKEKEDEHIQSKGESGNDTASTSVENRINDSKGKGSSLPEDTKKGMEQSFGTDFSGVRIHTGGNAAKLSNDLRAQAFTHGKDIYFNSGKYSPDSSSGKHLLAHELTHVVQQNGAGKPAISKKEAFNLCDITGKNRPKTVPNASSLLTERYTHLAKVINSKQLEKIQTMLDTQYKIAELTEKMEDTKVGSINADNNKYRKYEQEAAKQRGIQIENYNFYIETKLIASDDIMNAPEHAGENERAFHEQLYKRFTEKDVRITIQPCFFDESNVLYELLKFEWINSPLTVPRKLPHEKGLVTYKNLMAWQDARFERDKAQIGDTIVILGRLLELIRILGDSMFEAPGKKLGWIWGPSGTDVKIGREIGSLSGYLNDARGYTSMYADLMNEANGKTTRVVLLSPKNFLHIFAIDPNFDTTVLTSQINDNRLYVLDKGRDASINVFDNHFFTKDQFTLTYGGTSSDDRGWSTPRVLSEYEEFAIGAIFGDAFEVDSGMATFGQITIGMIPIVGQIADARDVCVGIHKMWTSDFKDGKAQTGLALVGFVPVFGDWIKRGARVSKGAPIAVRKAASAKAVKEGSEKMGGGVSRSAAKQIEEATADGAGKKGAKQKLSSLKEVGSDFVEGVMDKANKATPEAASDIAKTDGLKGVTDAHGRKLTDLQNPKVLAEGSFKIGETPHTIKIVEIGNLKQIWLCSTCGSFIGKLDEALETASGPAAEQLKKLRDSASELERKVTRGDVNPKDAEKQVQAMTAELNNIARKNPDMAGLTKLLREDLEKKYRKRYGKENLDELEEGTKQALARNYEPTPEGYHWRWDGARLQVVMNPGGIKRDKLLYRPDRHVFDIDLDTAVSKKFGNIKAPEAFTELGGDNLASDFGKFVKTMQDVKGVSKQQLIDDLARNNAGGFKELSQDSVRHTLKTPYINNLYAHITDGARLKDTATYKRVLASTKDANKALRAASHEELIRIGNMLGNSDKGSLGERWVHEWFSQADETVKKQIVLGPEQGIKEGTRKIDIVQGELAREVKNVTTPVGEAGTKQLEGLMIGAEKKATKDGLDMSYDSVRWLFVDPTGAKANARWMAQQLAKYEKPFLSFQILNKEGMPLVLWKKDIAGGEDAFVKIVEDWVNLKKKSIGINPADSAEMEADAMADQVVNKSKPSFFGPGKNDSRPFFTKSSLAVQRKCDACENEEQVQRKEDTASNGIIQREDSCQGPVGPDGAPPVCAPEEEQSSTLVCESPPPVPDQSTDSSTYIPPEEQVCNAPDTPIVQDALVEFTLQQTALVNAKEGIRLHTTPDTEDYDYKKKLGKASIIYARYDPVTIIGIGKIPAGVKSPARWAKIRTNTGQEGWIERRFLNEYDGTDNRVWKYHFVEKGDKVVKIIQKHYYDIFDIKYGQDERAVAQAISYLNRGNAAVYHYGEYDSSIWKDDILDRSMEEARKNFQTVKLREGGMLKLPTGEYIHELIDLGHVSSRPAWKNTVFKIGRSIQGFLQGVVEGFIDAAVDMVTGLWDLVKSIITGDIVDQAKTLYDTISELGWSGLWDLLKEAFFGEIIKLKKWIDGENPQKKWWAIGKIVGMIAFEIVLAIFTAGVGTALKASARVGKVLSRVQKVTSKVPGLNRLMNKSRGGLSKVDDKVKNEVVEKFDKVDLHKEKSLQESFDASVKKPGKALTHMDMKSEAEWVTKNQNLLEPSSVDGYVDQIELPKGADWTEKHYWRRDRDGHWCRFSEPQCVTPKEAEDLGLNVVEERSARLSTNIDDVKPNEVGEITIEKEVIEKGQKKTVGTVMKVHAPTNDPVVNMKLITEKNLLLDVSKTDINVVTKMKINPDFVPDQILGKGNKLVKNTEGLSNRQIAAKGNTPYVADGVPVELHHTSNNFFGEVEEMSTSFHKSVGKDLDHHPMADDPAYTSWRGEYGVYNGKKMTLEDVYNKQRTSYWKNRWP
jgi:hypothetical protein